MNQYRQLGSYSPSHIILTPGQPVMFCGPKFITSIMQAGTTPIFWYDWIQQRPGIELNQEPQPRIPTGCAKGDIDSITNSIKQIYIESGKKVGVINSKLTTHRIFATPKAQQRKTNHKPWFDDTCKQSGKDFFLAKNCFKISPNASNKKTMNDKCKAYRKTIRSAYNSYHSDLQQKGPKNILPKRLLGHY